MSEPFLPPHGLSAEREYVSVALERLRYRVVRLEAQLVMRDLEAAVARVRDVVADAR